MESNHETHADRVNRELEEQKAILAKSREDSDRHEEEMKALLAQSVLDLGSDIVEVEKEVKDHGSD